MQYLEALGYLEAATHYVDRISKVGDVVDATTGTLYAVRLRPGHMAHLPYDDATASALHPLQLQAGITTRCEAGIQADERRNLDEDKITKRNSAAVLFAYNTPFRAR